MQIFVPSPDPAYSAASLDDARVIKMATETAQLLSAAGRVLRGQIWANAHGLYRMPPSGSDLYTWAAKTDGNWDWLASHGKALLDELDMRGLCVGKLIVPRELLALFYEPGMKQEVFAAAPAEARHRSAEGFVNRAVNQAHGLDFRQIADVHEAYRTYLQARWAIEGNRAKWTVRGKPAWAV